MYIVDESFMDAMHSDVIIPCLRGKLNGVDFTGEDILSDSFRVANQCVDTKKITLGGVYVGELKMTLLPTIASTRGNWLGKKISCEYGLIYDDVPHYIPCPSGEYTIYSAVWIAEGLEVIAYDNMSKFDQEYQNEQSNGRAYDWLRFMCRRCGVELGMTQEEVEALPNGKEMLGLYDTSVIETYRDALSYIAAALCSFATINRTGQLILKTFKQDIDDSIDETKRFAGGSFSDYETEYKAISVVDMSTGAVDKIGSTKGIELTVELGKNPFLQLGLKGIKYQIRNNIKEGLKAFKYTPFDVTLLGCCVYDLGDVIEFTGGIAGRVKGSVMMYDFGLNDYSFYGFGENPAMLSAHDALEKSVSGLNGAVENKSLGIAQTTNISEFELSTNWQTLGSLKFAVAESQTCLFHAVSKFNLRISGPVEFRYRVNSDVLDFIHEVQMPFGIDTATLFIPFAAVGGIPTTFEVQVKSTDAQGTVQPLDLRGAVLGSGIQTDDWDGIIRLEDEFGRITRHRGIRNITETEIRFTKRTPIKANVEDLFERIIREDRVKTFDYDYRITMKINEYTRIEENEDEVTRITEDGIIRTTIGGFALDGN